MSKEFITLAHYPNDADRLCEFCDANPPRTPDSKWCESCRDEYKESVSKWDQ